MRFSGRDDSNVPSKMFKLHDLVRFKCTFLKFPKQSHQLFFKQEKSQNFYQKTFMHDVLVVIVHWYAIKWYVFRRLQWLIKYVSRKFCTDFCWKEQYRHRRRRLHCCCSLLTVQCFTARPNYVPLNFITSDFYHKWKDAKTKSFHSFDGNVAVSFNKVQKHTQLSSETKLNSRSSGDDTNGKLVIL